MLSVFFHDFNAQKIFEKISPFFSFLMVCKWRLHLWVGCWGTKVWTETTAVNTPLGFKLQSGLHPAYEMMRKGTFEIDETQVILSVLPHVDVFAQNGHLLSDHDPVTVAALA